MPEVCNRQLQTAFQLTLPRTCVFTTFLHLACMLTGLLQGGAGQFCERRTNDVRTFGGAVSADSRTPQKVWSQQGERPYVLCEVVRWSGVALLAV